MEKTNRPAVSVIIPVYNAEKYLSECLDSLLVQTMSDFEILCIDDGSTDSSAALLSAYAARDSRITVITQANSGCGPARNTGIDHARGEYIIFLDADDFFAEDLLARLYERARETDADLTMCRFRFYDTSTAEYGKTAGLKLNLLKDHPVLSHKDCNGDLSMINTPAVWTNLYRTDLIRRENIRFPSLANTEDVYFIFMASYLADRITWIKDAPVSYRKGVADSIDTLKHRQPLCFIEAERLICNELKRRGLYEEAENDFINLSAAHIYYNLNEFSSYLPGLAEAAEELVYRFFPETGMLDHPDQIFVNPRNITYLRHLDQILKEYHASAECISADEVNAGKISLLNTEICLQADRIEQLQAKITKLKRSHAYQASRMITYLPQKIKKLLHKKKQS